MREEDTIWFGLDDPIDLNTYETLPLQNKILAAKKLFLSKEYASAFDMAQHVISLCEEHDDTLLEMHTIAFRVLNIFHAECKNKSQAEAYRILAYEQLEKLAEVFDSILLNSNKQFDKEFLKSGVSVYQSIYNMDYGIYKDYSKAMSRLDEMIKISEIYSKEKAYVYKIVRVENLIFLGDLELAEQRMSELRTSCSLLNVVDNGILGMKIAHCKGDSKTAQFYYNTAIESLLLQGDSKKIEQINNAIKTFLRCFEKKELSSL